MYANLPLIQQSSKYLIILKNKSHPHMLLPPFYPARISSKTLVLSFVRWIRKRQEVTLRGISTLSSRDEESSRVTPPNWALQQKQENADCLPPRKRCTRRKRGTKEKRLGSTVLWSGPRNSRHGPTASWGGPLTTDSPPEEPEDLSMNDERSRDSQSR